MKTLWSFLGAIVSALVIVPAMAADLPTKAPIMKAPPAPVYNWTGCYIAGGGGYGLYDIEHNVTNPVVGALPPVFDIGHDNGGRGWFGSVGGGCDLQFASPLGSSGLFGGNWVFGILGDYDFMSIKGNYSYLCPGGCIAFAGGGLIPVDGFIGQRKESSAGYIGARLGWVVSPQLLTYVSGGWTETQFDGATLVDGSGATTVAVALGSQTYNGWFIGGGTEYAIGWLPGLFWRSEYRFAQYSGKSSPFACLIPAGGAAGCSTAPGVNAIDNAKPNVQTVRSELVWRFNWGGGSIMSRY
jgi:outer membrane immunogenic protein